MNKQDYINKVLGLCESGTVLASEYINAKTKVTLVCSEGHTREVITNDIVSRGRHRTCNICKGFTSSGKKTQESVYKEFLLKGYEVTGEYLGALLPISVKHIICGKISTVIAGRANKPGEIICAHCSGRRNNYTTELFSKELATGGVELLDKYTNMHTNVSVRYIACGHITTINPGHYLYDKHGTSCSTCSGLGSLKTRFLSKLLENNLELVETYSTSQTPTLVLNTKCSHTYSVIPNNLVCAASGLECRICTPIVRVSKAEIEIYDYIRTIYSGWVIQSDRTFLDGKELDIIIPDLGIAIEYNGHRWHDVESKGENYHLEKTKKVEALEYQLIHIFEFEWLNTPEIVKSRLANLIGASNKLYARKTLIKRIDYPAKFLKDNHIQGSNATTSINYGLFYLEELVAVMTFSTPRFSTATKYELVRYCSRLGTTVVGGASKLLKQFRKDFEGSILSYSDKRWSIGNLYKQLGFKLSHTSKPNYRYYKYKHSLSRYQCQKHLLKDLVPEYYTAELSETEIMYKAGYYKVFDCGNDVWILK